MDETYGTYVGDECFDIRDYDDDTDHDTNDDTDDGTDDDTTDDTDDDTDDSGRRDLYTIKAQGSRTKDQGSRIKVEDQGPSLAMNEHPRRATDVVLRQSKAPIELFHSRWVPWLNWLNSWSKYPFTTKR